MPLPQNVSPTYRLKLPSSGKEIQYRPFVVKEEKILIIALESEDQRQIIDAMKTVLKNCITTKGIKIDDLPTFDLEYLFLNIRARSIGEIVKVNVVCPDDGVTSIQTEINLFDISVETQEGHSRDINLGNNLMLRMKYPSINQFVEQNFSTVGQSVDSSFDLVASCIETVYQGDEAWSAKDVSKKELLDWVENLFTNQLQEIEKTFFDSMPVLRHRFKVINPTTNNENEIVMEGLASFFA